jgi:hypothetical protein
MSQPTSGSPFASASAARIQAIVGHGFTQRQATFLALVMRHSGVCVPRQYAQVAGIAQGAKCNAFFGRLVRRRHARAIECVHNRARLYLAHSRLLYHAIGEPSSRYRRPVSPRLALERVMLLDAILSTPADQWLTTPAEKAEALPLAADMKPSSSTSLPSHGRTRSARSSAPTRRCSRARRSGRSASCSHAASDRPPTTIREPSTRSWNRRCPRRWSPISSATSSAAGPCSGAFGIRYLPSL